WPAALRRGGQEAHGGPRIRVAARFAAGEGKKGAGRGYPTPNRPPLQNICRSTFGGGLCPRDAPRARSREYRARWSLAGHPPGWGLVTGADLLTWNGDRRGVGASVPPPPYGTRRSIRLFF